MISRIVLAVALSMLACFGRAAEPLKIGMVAPRTGATAEVGRYHIGRKVTFTGQKGEVDLATLKPA